MSAFDEGSSPIKIPIGGLWDDTEWELRRGVTVRDDWNGICPHAVYLKTESGKSYRRGQSEVRFYRVPWAIVARNEGGFASTGLCALCVAGALKTQGVICE